MLQKCGFATFFHVAKKNNLCPSPVVIIAEMIEAKGTQIIKLTPHFLIHCTFVQRNIRNRDRVPSFARLKLEKVIVDIFKVSKPHDVRV